MFQLAELNNMVSGSKMPGLGNCFSASCLFTDAAHQCKALFLCVYAHYLQSVLSLSGN